MRKRQWSVALATCASLAVVNRWHSINWGKCESEVRKLQVRIVKALKAYDEYFAKRRNINRQTRPLKRSA